MIATLAASPPLTSTKAAFTTPTFSYAFGHAGKAFMYPWGIDTAIDGTILVGDYVNYNVKRFDTSGNFIGQFGSGGKGNGQFQQPNSVAVDRTDGSIYVSDPDRSQYQKWTKDGTWLYTVTATAPDLVYGVCYDAYLRVAANRNVYVVCSHGGLFPNEQYRVVVYDKDGKFIREYGSNGKAAGQFNIPRGIDFDAAGNIYIADTANHRVDVFDSNFNFKYQFGRAGTAPGQLGASVRGLVVDKVRQWVYVTDATNGRVHKFTLGGTWLGDVGMTGTDAGQFVGPRQSTVDANGNLYVTDYAGWKVNKYDSSGGFIDQIPNPSIPAPLGGFSQPNGLAVDNANGWVYVTDTFNQRVQKFTIAGKAIDAWGTRTLPRTGPYNMNYPRGIAVDPSNSNVWLDDTRSGIVKEYDQNEVFLFEFGSEGAAPPGPEPQFQWNWGITVGPDGKLYIADELNYAVKVADQSGNVLMVLSCGTFGSSIVTSGCGDVTVDSSGNIWAADGSEHMIKEWDSSGHLIRQFGSSVLGLGYGIAVRNGLVYYADQGQNRVVVFNTSGDQVGAFGNTGTTATGKLRQPKALRISGDGHIFITDGGNSRIAVFCCAP